MKTDFWLRIAALCLGVVYMGFRFYYRARAQKADARGTIGSGSVTESKVRLALMAVGGLGINLLTILWLIQPAWVSWSRLPLPGWARWVGIVLGWIGVGLTYVVHRRLGNSFVPTLETKEEHVLVTDGIYRWVRHPLYSTYFIHMVASFLFVANWLVALLGLIYALMLLQRVGHEEEMLLEQFGDRYRDYMAHTGRFFPRLI
jgi:protein-S-isoprenylcysteine O-methyltransferase Ste14